MITDVVVIGGGPGGSVCASLLAKRGLSVIVLERDTFPRFHLGESLLPQSLSVLEEVGVLPKVRERFLAKYGARFHDDIRNKKDRFSFDGAWKVESDHAFQVPRAEFDALLLDHARSCGADVRERWTVTKLATDASGRACGVSAIDPATANETQIDARFVVDASGRDALTAHASSSTSKIDGLDQTAIYAHFKGVPRESGKLEGDIDLALFANTERERPNWFWFIPFKDGTTSVGLVVSRDWIREHRTNANGSAATTTTTTTRTTDALFDLGVSQSPTAALLLANATCLWPKKEASADFSYRVRSMSGAGWLAVGDAGGFIDPLFSTGAHLAMMGSKLAAEAIASMLANPENERAVMDEWEARTRGASETFVSAVEAFYRGPLIDYLFMQDKRTSIRRSITSLLAGDVFGDAIWLRDTRLRLKSMLLEDSSLQSPVSSET